MADPTVIREVGEALHVLGLCTLREETKLGFVFTLLWIKSLNLAQCLYSWGYGPNP